MLYLNDLWNSRTIFNFGRNLTKLIILSSLLSPSTISSSAGDTVGQGEAGKGRELVTLVTGTRYRGRQFCIKENGVADGGRCLTNAGPVLLARRTFATLVAKSGTNGTSVFLFFFFTLLPARSLPGLCNISTGIFILHEAKALIKGKKYYIYIYCTSFSRVVPTLSGLNIFPSFSQSSTFSERRFHISK